MSLVTGVAVGAEPEGVGPPAGGAVASRTRLHAVPAAAEVSHRSAGSRVRLTRRGRATLLGLLVALLTSGLVGWGAMSTGSASTTVPQHEVKVVVASGDTLWTIAAVVAPETDRRVTVERIMTANDLENPRIEPGQQLVVPVDTP